MTKHIKKTSPIHVGNVTIRINTSYLIVNVSLTQSDGRQKRSCFGVVLATPRLGALIAAASCDRLARNMLCFFCYGFAVLFYHLFAILLDVPFLAGRRLDVLTDIQTSRCESVAFIV